MFIFKTTSKLSFKVEVILLLSEYVCVYFLANCFMKQLIDFNEALRNSIYSTNVKHQPDRLLSYNVTLQYSESKTSKKGGQEVKLSEKKAH